MKKFQLSEIRNVVLLGHGGSGKTSLAEAMLYLTGTSDRLGRVEDGNTVCDFDPEEIKRKVSVSTAIAPFEWQNSKINIIDTPGLFDFECETLEGIRAADCAVITVSGKSGVNVGTEKAWKRVSRGKLPRAFFVSKLDAERADFYKVLEGLKAAFGATVCPIVVPFTDDKGVTVYINLIEMKAYQYNQKSRTEVSIPDTGHRMEGLKTAISEAVAETSDEYFEKYFSGEAFTKEELITGIHKGIREGSIAPVYCGSSITLSGIDMLIDSISRVFPSAGEADSEIAETQDGEAVEVACSDKDPAVMIVFKTLADPYVGKLSYFKVLSGEVTPETMVANARTGQQEKLGKLYMLRGKKQIEADKITAGDIGAVSKMASPLTGDTLCSPARILKLHGIEFPEPCLSMAVAPKSKGDEDKISQGLRRLTEEDLTCRFEIDHETKQQILSGLGEQHLDVIISKLKTKFGVAVDLNMPIIPYRETIRKKVKVQGKHKKQTGGHGQYGDVWIEFEPGDSEELVFEEKVFGGAVPRNFFPAVEKGLRECVLHGVLAGYPVVHLKATLVDGSYHPVDSSEMAFKVAATLAYKAGLAQASPALLEPICSLKTNVPDNYMGDIIGEINKRRGRVLGMDHNDDGLQVIEAEVPMGEMHDFTTVLRSMTQGRGSFSLKFERYEEAPPQIAQAVVAKSKQTEQAAS